MSLTANGTTATPRDSVSPPIGDHDDDLLGVDDLLGEGVAYSDVCTLLGPHSALTRRELTDRYDMMTRARGAAR